MPGRITRGGRLPRRGMRSVSCRGLRQASRKRGKTDGVDAEAIAEAVTRLNMRFVPVNLAKTQAALLDHKSRDFLVRQRTQIIDAIRAHMGEFGIVVAKGFQNIERLIAAARNMPEAAGAAVDMLPGQL